MTTKKCNLFFLICCLIISFSSFSQDVQTANLIYTPDKSGYELNVPFKWKFINCFGEVHVTITKNSKDITSSAYIYNGKRYTSQELGSELFIKPEVGLTSILVDLYDGSYRLGEAKLGNVIDWFGGCIGQTYHITQLIGLQDSEYKNKLSSLSLRNLRFADIGSVSLKVESKINELEKQKSIQNKLREADNAYRSNNLESAKTLYEEALKMDANNEQAKSKLQEINTKLKAQKEKEALTAQKDKAKELYDSGNYEAAKQAYEKALAINPNDAEAKRMLGTINDKLKNEKEKKEKERIENEQNAQKANAAKAKKESAVSEASNRRHSGRFISKAVNSRAAQSGTAFQNTNLIGLFRVEYDMWSLSGEPAHKFRFYWEWDNALHTGYPQYVSVLNTEIVHIADLKKYPDLLARWNNIKPLYIEIESDVLSFKNNDNFVASTGRIHIIPEVIGKSGQVVDWSLPSSPKWDELFNYTNYMNWDYFRNLGLYEEIDQYSKEFGNDIAWAKYAFEYSNDINFFQGYSYLSSDHITFTDEDFNNYSSSAYVNKVVWPEAEMLKIIEEFLENERRAKEEKMKPEDFWNSSENDEKAIPDDFWNTPDNSKTVEDVKTENKLSENLTAMKSREPIILKQREKYKALQNPFTITEPKNNSTVNKNVIEVKGSINQYFQKNSNKVFLHLNGVKQEVNVSNGRFSNPMVLANGENKIQLELQGNGFTIKQPQTVYYDGVDTDIRVTLTWDGSGDLDLRVINPNNVMCSYSYKNTAGMTLDVDNRGGYGPENISVVDGVRGQYKIQVQNYSRAEGREATVYIFKNEQLIATKSHTFYNSKEMWNVMEVQLN